MSAEDNLSKRQFPELFHGTNVELNEGDLITPPKSGPRSLVFATEHPEFAKGHARRAAANDPLKSAHRDKDTAKYSKKGIVYKVEPTEHIRRDPLSGGKAGGVWVSKTGFKVVGKHK
jgi:hypothetical protein